MISIYAPDCTDFSTNGLGLLYPTECTVEERAGGLYEMEIVHPIGDTLRWAQIAVGCIIKVSVPARENPAYELDALTETTTQETTVTRSIYKVRTNTGARLRLRSGPGTNYKIISSHKPGTEVVRLDANGSWYKVSIREGGAVGWMHSAYLTKVKDIQETVSTIQSVTREGVKVQPAREQLFRVYEVQPDSQAGTVTAKAMHIFYDLRGNVYADEYEPENVAANAVIAEMAGKLLNPCDFRFYAPNLTAKYTGDCSFKSPVEILLDPEEGIAKNADAQVIRDGYDVYVLPDQVRDMGVTVRRGKNLIGVTVTTDAADVVTRIIPEGRTKDGDPLYLDGDKYVDSPHINDYPVVYAQRIEYDVRVVDKDPDNETTFKNVADARKKLRELAEAEYSENGVDLPTYGMEVDFALIQYADEYADYAALQAVHLYDTVTVIDGLIGLYAKVRVTGYTWNVLTQQYESVTLGELSDVQQTVYSYNLSGGISGTKIANGSLPGSALRSATLDYAKIGVAAIEQLMANSLTAVRAHINELVAGKITTDQLYADLATIAVAEITTANIERANIDWAAIETLTAGIATLARAEITDANIQRADINWANIISAHIGEARIDWADIERLNAAVAEIADARIGSATISTAQIDQLSATVAEAVTLTVRTGTFDYASVENLLAQAMVLRQGVAGTISINNLLVTSANLLNATVGELVLKGEDGKYYQVNVDSAGELTAAEVTVSAAEIAAGQTSTGRQIVETNMNVAALNATELMAQTAAIGDILTLALTAEKITAGQALLASATVPTLYTTAIRAIGDTLDISANSSIRLLVGDIDAARKSINGMMVGTRNYVRYSEKLWWDGHYGQQAFTMRPIADLCLPDGVKCG